MKVLLEMGEKLAKLIDVKSIVTILLVAVLCYMTVTGQSTPDLFNNSVMLVLGFFFGKKVAEKIDETIDKKEESEVKSND